MLKPATHQFRTIALLGVLAVTTTGLSAAPAANNDERARRFIAAHEEKVRPLDQAAQLAWWTANTTGKDEAFKAKEEAQNRLDLALCDKARFAELTAIRRDKVSDPVLARQIEILHLQYLEKQVDPALLRKMTAKANAVEKVFNTTRAKVDGKELTDSQVRSILKESKSSDERRKVWEASKSVGALVAADLKELITLRNESARALGFSDYHVLQLHLAEQNQADVLKLFDELDVLTREPFAVAKAEIDSKLAQNCGVRTDQLRPWHYHDPFFQESPAVFAANLDRAFTGVDILKLCREFYQGIGLPVDAVLAASDLYEKPGKCPHAFSIDIDRQGDVRVLANIVPNEHWMGTMLHELGHSVYSSQNIPAQMPWVLRSEAHILCTEGMAMMMERFSKRADWLVKMGVSLDNPDEFNRSAAKIRRNELLIFSRWCQVMLRFEKEMYAHPDQDLNKLWYDLVDRYQQVRRPEGRNAPDYAAKIHIVTAPAYYHNYVLGQMFACQVFRTIARDVLKTDPSKALFNGNKEVGKFLKERIFSHGRMYSWNDLVRRATGEELKPRAFAAEFGAN